MRQQQHAADEGYSNCPYQLGRLENEEINTPADADTGIMQLRNYLEEVEEVQHHRQRQHHPSATATPSSTATPCPKATPSSSPAPSYAPSSNFCPSTCPDHEDRKSTRLNSSHR